MFNVSDSVKQFFHLQRTHGVLQVAMHRHVHQSESKLLLHRVKELDARCALLQPTIFQLTDNAILLLPTNAVVGIEHNLASLFTLMQRTLYILTTLQGFLKPLLKFQCTSS